MTGIPVAPGELVDVGYLNEVARAHYRKTTAKQVLNSVVETDLLNGEITIDAGAMGTARALRINAFGDLVNSTGAAQATPRLKLKLGATTLLDTNVIAAAWSSNALRFPWHLDATILNLGGASSQWATMLFESSLSLAVTSNAVFTTGEGFVRVTSAINDWVAQGGGAGAVNTALVQALAFTVTNPLASASLDVTLKGALVEVI